MPKCPLCNSPEPRKFHTSHNSPLLQAKLYKSEAEAKSVRRVDATFFYCAECHFIFNPDFRETDVDYDASYNNSQTTSPYYRNYLEELVVRLIRDCNLPETTRILEIGCGDGYVLSCFHKSLKNCIVTGYDPTYKGQYGISDFVIRDYFQPGPNDQYDLIIIRHVLEGMPNFRTVVENSIKALAPNGKVYFETTRLNYLLENNLFYTLYHEYARYFSMASLQRLFNRYNLELYSSFRLFKDQYCGAIAVHHKGLDAFVGPEETFRQVVESSTKVVVWGLAGRAVGLLTQMGWDTSVVQFGVDIDQDKQGLYLPVTGQRILSPQEAVQLHPDLVIVSNPNYLMEIKKMFSYPVRFICPDGQTSQT